MKSAITTTKGKGTMVRAEPITIRTVDVDAFARLPSWCH